MTRKQIIVVSIIVLVFILGVVSLIFGSTPEVLEDGAALQEQAAVEVEETLPPATDGLPTDENEASEPLSATVVYSDGGFSPSSVTVNAGDTVMFKNESSRSFWPASALHPTHTVYPGSDIKLCGTDAEEELFDSCGSVGSGGSYSFIFTEVGSWKYHDHLNPSKFGEVVVQ